MVGQVGHSRKLPLRDLLELVGEDHTSWHLVIEAMLRFPVVDRTVQKGLEALEWGGYLTRARAREGDKRSWVVSITDSGRETLSDPGLAEALESLPQRHREHKAWLRDPLNPEPTRAKVEQWRAEMRL